MKRIFNNILIKNYLILLIFMFMLELGFRMISGNAVVDTALLRIFLGLNLLALGISFLLSWTNSSFSKFFIILFTFFLSSYVFFQLGFNNFIGVYASINTSSQLGAVTAYIKDFFASFLPKFYLAYIPFIILIGYYIFIDKYTEIKFNKMFVLKSHIKYEPFVRCAACLVLIAFGAFLYNKTVVVSFMQNKIQTVSNKDLFKYPSVPSLAINQFGILGFGLLDVKSLGQDNISTNLEYASIDTQNTNRKIDDTDFQKVIDEETNDTYNNISNYLINSKITDYNDHTGLFEGKNLIVIMMESVDEIFINKDLYPNFYKLYSEGISFENNYSPRNSCATGNNEFSGMTGLYTIQNNCTANTYRNNTYFTSIFNLFNKAGYRTSSMHNYTENYYYRSIIHRNLGSSKYYGVQDLKIPYYNEYKNWSSDEDFMKVAMDITLDDSSDAPFMLWLTTVSSHQPYKVSSVEGDKYLSITEGTDYPMDLRRYMSKLKTLDNALGILLERLEDAGVLDDTVIALYGDHYPYGLSNDTISNVLTYNLDDYDVEKTPMVIYNSDIKAQVVTKYSSYINLTPTIANLFNLDYDPRFYMGTDVFSDDYLNLVVFADGSWKNDIAYYNAGTASIKYYTDKTYTTEEIVDINKVVTAKMQISSSIIQNNYFNYLDNKLKEQTTDVLASVEE